MPEPHAGTLRERQRARVREDIQRAALALIAERGYDSVSTEEIAAAAGVSMSTYFRYVPTKEGLLLDTVRGGGAAIVRALRAQPEHETAHAALTAAITARMSAFDDVDVDHWRTAVLSAPHLLERVSLIGSSDRAALVDLVAARIGVSSQDSVRPGLMVEVFLAAGEFAFHRWLTAPPGRIRLSELVSRCLVLIPPIDDEK